MTEIVSINLPSGFTFQFKRPTLLGLLSAGIMPESIANEAVEAWLKDGIGSHAQAAETGYKSPEQQRRDEVQRSRAIQRKIIELSYLPKLVAGIADKSKGEISWSALPLEDVQFIHKWFLTGGYDCGELSAWAKNHEMVLSVALNADKMHMPVSAMLNVDNEIIAYEINKICTHRLLIWEADQIRDKAKLDWYVAIMAQAGKPLEFNDQEFFDPDITESFPTAGGISRKRRKSEHIERDETGKPTERQVAAWRAQGCEVW